MIQNAYRPIVFLFAKAFLCIFQFFSSNQEQPPSLELEEQNKVLVMARDIVGDRDDEHTMYPIQLLLIVDYTVYQ